MDVRAATRDDLLQIARVADTSIWESFSELMGSAAIQVFLRRRYSPAVLKRRLLSGGILVAEDDTGRLAGFADAEVTPDHVRLNTVVTAPSHRRRGSAAALVRALQHRTPDLPVCLDVILGNLDGERFCESLGFVPGEVFHQDLGAEDVVVRRWWCSPVQAGRTSVVV
jgi:GNAT superfamily N-acetyltransferase